MAVKVHQRAIDGLRAVAVLAVILYHGFPGLLPGGFTGVDIFFVISGYLITGIIWEKLNEGRFSLLDFYDRRVRRIVPALLVVLTFVTTMAAWMLFPADLKEYGRSLLTSSASVANIGFYRRGGYFDGDVGLMPLLHTWSLAVEEQFYFVLPFILLGLHRWARRFAIPSLVVLIVASFWLCLKQTANDQNAAFYLTHYRAWELGIGALLAVWRPPALTNSLARAGVCGAGLIAIVCGYMLIDKAHFPGLPAVVPTLGAAAVIYGSQGGTWVSAPLTSRFMVGIGLISYSLYLWHWPLLVFARHLYAGPAPVWLIAVCLMVAFPLAWLSWRFVEQPARQSYGRIGRTAALVLGIGCLFAAALVGAALFKLNGLPGRLTPEVNALAQSTIRPELPGCSANSIAPGSGRSVESRVVGADVPAHYVLWGDCHADHLVPEFDALARSHGQAVRCYMRGAVPPLLDPTGFGSDALATEAEQSAVLEVILADEQVHYVILAARWSMYLGGINKRDPAHEATAFLPWAKHLSQADIANRASRMNMQLNLIATRLKQAGKQLVIVYPVPEMLIDVPRTMATVLRYEGTRYIPTLSLDDFTHRQLQAYAVLDAVGPKLDVMRIYPHRAFLNGNQLMAGSATEAYYTNDHNLSRAGARLVSSELDAVFQSADLRQ